MNSPMPGTTPPPQRPEPILIVDDDIEFLQRVSRTMGAAGFQNVLMAVDYETALRLLEACHPLLALVDLDLGEEGRTGIDLIELLIERTDGPIPVVLSGDRTFAQFFRAARAGAIDFLVKGPHVNVPSEVSRILSGDRGAAPGRNIPKSITELGYLRSFGLTKREFALITEFVTDFPNLSELAVRMEKRPVQLRKRFSRIYEKLNVADLHQLIRTLTVCELFYRES